MFLRRMAMGVFLLLFFGFLLWFNLTKPRILVMHSYAPDFSWVRDINIGINRVFKGKPYLIRWHYLDTKRNPDEEYMRRAGATGRAEVLKWKPDIILAVDDNAQEMVAKYFIDDPSLSVIFTGVNADPQKYGYDKATNVTGVLERIPFDGVHETFSLINPNGKFVHICDSSKTSEYIQKELEDFNWAPLRLVETRLCPTIKDWREAVERANTQADFLLITHYHTIKDENGLSMRPRDVLTETKKICKLPMVGCWDFFVEDGGMLSLSVSPFEQGEEAARIAEKIIELGEKPKDVPFFRNSQFTISMRGSELKRFKIRIPIVFEAFARGLNNYY